MIPEPIVYVHIVCLHHGFMDIWGQATVKWFHPVLSWLYVPGFLTTITITRNFYNPTPAGHGHTKIWYAFKFYLAANLQCT
jgi:hypothetical protein